MAEFLTEPFPSRDPIVDPRTGKAAAIFTRWNEEGLLRRLASTPVLPDPVVRLTNKTAGASGTFGGALSGGLYAFHGYAQILTPAAVANTLQLTLGWTFNGVAQTEVFPVLNGLIVGAVSTRGSHLFTMQITPNSSVSYSVAYTSNPAAAMVWSAALGLTLLQPIR